MPPLSNNGQRRSPSDGHSPSSGTQRRVDETDIQQQLEEADNERRNLEKLRDVKAKIADLQKENERLDSITGGKRKRIEVSPPPERRSKIEMTNIKKFHLNFKVQDRLEWLADVKRDFEGAPWNYRHDTQKILHALSLMEPICRQRWDRHFAEKILEVSRSDVETWEHFEEWTITLIKNSLTIQADAMVALNAARQRPGQDPRDFHAYLDSLEQNFERAPEEERAYHFHAKLRFELRTKIEEHLINLPKTRDQMVLVATQFWNKMEAAKRHINRPERPRRSTRFRKTSHREYQRTSTEEKPKGYLPKQGRSSKFHCYICDSPEHLADRCPNKKSNSSRPKDDCIRHSRVKVQSTQADEDPSTITTEEYQTSSDEKPQDLSGNDTDPR